MAPLSPENLVVASSEQILSDLQSDLNTSDQGIRETFTDRLLYSVSSVSYCVCSEMSKSLLISYRESYGVSNRVSYNVS